MLSTWLLPVVVAEALGLEPVVVVLVDIERNLPGLQKAQDFPLRWVLAVRVLPILAVMVGLRLLTAYLLRVAAAERIAITAGLQWVDRVGLGAAMAAQGHQGKVITGGLLTSPLATLLAVAAAVQVPQALRVRAAQAQLG
jgi:hypothetical protein